MSTVHCACVHFVSPLVFSVCLSWSTAVLMRLMLCADLCDKCSYNLQLFFSISFCCALSLATDLCNAGYRNIPLQNNMFHSGGISDMFKNRFPPVTSCKPSGFLPATFILNFHCLLQLFTCICRILSHEIPYCNSPATARTSCA